MGRHAPLIGVSSFTDNRLAQLNAPVNDVIKLQAVLQEPSLGNFDSLELSLNEDFLPVRDRLSHLFQDRVPEDVLLLYYSGHGILSRGNRLFLATAGSNLDTPTNRSISAREIREFIEESRAQSKVVVLDCCHSGAFAEGAKSVGSVPAITMETFSSGSSGVYVLTAADALQFAWDGEQLRAGNRSTNTLSRFTSWMIEGLETGAAAPDDDQITMDALHRYLSRRARSEGSTTTPQRFVSGAAGDLAISTNPAGGASHVDPAIAAALTADDYTRRLGAVTVLTQQMRRGDLIKARAARLMLQRRLQDERDYGVREQIERALTEDKQRPPDTEEAKTGIQQRSRFRFIINFFYWPMNMSRLPRWLRSIILLIWVLVLVFVFRILMAP
jgi:hypothetical protein